MNENVEISLQLLIIHVRHVVKLPVYLYEKSSANLDKRSTKLISDRHRLLNTSSLLLSSLFLSFSVPSQSPFRSTILLPVYNIRTDEAISTGALNSNKRLVSSIYLFL